MNNRDLLKALDWLTYRNSAKRRSFGQDIIDKVAMHYIYDICTGALHSEEAKDHANDAYQKALSSRKIGETEEICNLLARDIIKGSERESFDTLLLLNPDKIQRWTRLWNAVQRRKEK